MMINYSLNELSQVESFRSWDSISMPLDAKIFILKLENWVKCYLPQINNDVLAKRTNISELIEAAQPWFGDTYENLSKFELNVWTSRKLIQLLSYIMSSVARHLKENGYEAEYVFSLLPQSEYVMLSLSLNGQHPPRDTFYTNYLWNEAGLTFTNDPKETHFNNVTRQVNDLNVSSSNMLRHLCDSVEVISPDAIDLINTAIQNSLTIQKLYQSFFDNDDNGNPRMTGEFFTVHFRAYKVPLIIGGKKFTGANAGHVPSQIQMDYVTGLALPTYISYVKTRVPHLIEEDRHALFRDMDRNSLLDNLLNALQISEKEVVLWSDNQLKVHLEKQPPNSIKVLNAYCELHKTISKMSGTHRALIKNFIVNAARNIPIEQINKMAVSPHRGAGGTSLDETYAVDEMRRHHPIATKLALAVQHLSPRL